MEREKVTIFSDDDVVVFTKQTKEEIVEGIESKFTEWETQFISNDMFVFHPSNGILKMVGIDLNTIFGIQVTKEKYYILCKSFLLVIYYREFGVSHTQSPQTTLRTVINKCINPWEWWFQLTHPRHAIKSLLKIISRG